MPRIGLTAERVVVEAGEVADEVGLDRLTLAAVAQRFGVSVPSLYKHVKGLEGLNRDLAVHAVRTLHDELARVAIGRSGKDALRAIAAAYRGYAHAHPGLVAAAVRAPAPDDTEHQEVSGEIIAMLAAALSEYRLSDSDMIDAIRMLRAAMHGFVTLETGGWFGIPRSVDATFTRLIDSLDAAYRSWGGAGRKP
jgi:AcrR family transcriptional regulator